jgi:hypothetical protein
LPGGGSELVLPGTLVAYLFGGLEAGGFGTGRGGTGGRESVTVGLPGWSGCRVGRAGEVRMHTRSLSGEVTDEEASSEKILSVDCDLWSETLDGFKVEAVCDAMAERFEEE